MDRYTQFIYELLREDHPQINDEIIARAARVIAEKHRSEGYSTSHAGWTESPIVWAETKAPVGTAIFRYRPIKR